jgi:hypothetical protein
MNPATLILSAVIGVLLIVFMMLLLAAITFNLKTAEKYRHSITVAVHSLRLGSMLQALGIDPQKFVHTVSMLEVHRNMLNCTTCQQHQRCDRELASGKLTAKTIHFCNNKQHLRELLQEQLDLRS